MNRQITHLFSLLVLLFGLLVAFTSRWTVFEAESLGDNPANRRPLLEEQRLPRGLILARDGTRLAVSRRMGSGERLRYVRSYPEGDLFSHVVGYSFIDLGRSGLERSHNDELTGEEDEFTTIVDELRGSAREGADLTTTLDPDAQRAALQALGGRRGAVVALEPDSGRVRVMASVPGYDPNAVPDDFRRLVGRSGAGRGSPLFNRTTQAGYPPGSTFKVVTAAAALDSGKFKPDSLVDGRSPKTISGAPLENFGGTDYPLVTLTEALTRSVNTVFAEVGERVGKGTMFRYMERFGFGEEPPIDLPGNELSVSGVYAGRRILDAGDRIDIGRVAIGQERLRVTPLQMAMVAAAVGNEGRLMEPRLLERVVATDGRVKERFDSDQAARVMKASTARQLAGMMGRVVEEGSGTQAALEGIEVAGKTGTAEVDGGDANQAWFIAFAPIDRPRVAVAVTVERTQGFGGTVAAPIARTVLQRLLSRG